MFGKTETVKLKIGGMHCGHCRAAVEAAIKSIKGVKKAGVDLENACAEAVYNPEKTNPEEMIKAVESAGFSAELA